jgi:lysylphosphatidylglycerol synthetase-like protein (DUF2156 family)
MTLTASPTSSLTATALALPPPTPPDTAAAAAILLRHAENPSAFLSLNTGTRQFFVPGIDGMIAYAPAGRRCLVQFGGVFAAPEDQDPMLDEFLGFAARQRRRVVSVQLLRPDAERYLTKGFTVNQFGTSYSCSLADFSLQGRAFSQLRNKISKARRAGIVVAEVGVDRPNTTDLVEQMDAIDKDWLRSKGRHVKQLAFMVGERGGSAAPLRRLFVATGPSGQVVSYITFSPAYGTHAGWLYDLPRRRPDAPQGTIQLVMISAIERFQAEQAGYLHLGLTPFSGIAGEHELPGRSRTAACLVQLLAEHGRHIYPAADQVAFKRKWAPEVVQPEYVAFAGGVRLRSVWSLLRLTNAI